jgi:hypothetical protein
VNKVNELRRRPSSWPPRRPRNSDAEVARPIRAGVHCSSAHIRQLGADAALEGVQPLVRSRYTFPSRLPDPDRLTVPARPVVVGSAPARTLRFQGRTAPSFSDPLRRAAVGSLIPLGHSTPRGALRARSTPGQVAGAATEKARARSSSSRNGLPNCVLREGPRPGRQTLGLGPDSNPQGRSFIPRGAEAGRLSLRMLPEVRECAARGGRLEASGPLQVIAPSRTRVGSGRAVPARSRRCWRLLPR